SPRRVANFDARHAAWSRDGQKLAYAQGNKIYVAKRDGTQSRELVTIPGLADSVRFLQTELMFGSPRIPRNSFPLRSGRLGLTALDCISSCRKAFIKTRASAAAIGVRMAVITFSRSFTADGPTSGRFEKSKHFGR